MLRKLFTITACTFAALSISAQPLKADTKTYCQTLDSEFKARSMVAQSCQQELKEAETVCRISRRVGREGYLITVWNALMMANTQMPYYWFERYGLRSAIAYTHICPDAPHGNPYNLKPLTHIKKESLEI